MLEHGPHNGCAASRERDDSLDVAFSCAPLTVEEGAGSRVSVSGGSNLVHPMVVLFNTLLAVRRARRHVYVMRIFSSRPKQCLIGTRFSRTDTNSLRLRTKFM
jgi:hypothetical protein